MGRFFVDIGVQKVVDELVEKSENKVKVRLKDDKISDNCKMNVKTDAKLSTILSIVTHKCV